MAVAATTQTGDQGLTLGRTTALLAGLRVRVGSDVYESSVAGQLATLSV